MRVRVGVERRVGVETEAEAVAVAEAEVEVEVELEAAREIRHFFLASPMRR